MEKKETEHRLALKVSKEWGLGKAGCTAFLLLPLSACLLSPELGKQTQNPPGKKKEEKNQERAEAQRDQEPVGFRAVPPEYLGSWVRTTMPGNLTALLWSAKSFPGHFAY